MVTNAAPSENDAKHDGDSANPAAPHISDFQAAERIRDLLAGRTQPEQERIVRWVGESLGLSVFVRHKGGAPATEHQEEATSPLTPGVADLKVPDERPKDIRTFVQEKQPSSDVQFAVIAAFYKRFVSAERGESISGEDLQEYARHASRPVFKTPSVTLNNAVSAGYLDRGARGEYKLNAVGENLVAMTLPGNEQQSSGLRPKRASKVARRRTKAPADKPSSKAKASKPRRGK